MIEPLLSQALLGKDAPIIAYGQTGSGKTYTLFGDESHTVTGDLTPKILNRLLKSPSVADLALSAIESYGADVNGIELFDLLNPQNQSRENGTKIGNKLANVEKFSCVHLKDENDIIQQVIIAHKASHYSWTVNIPASSRGHVVFLVTINLKTNPSDILSQTRTRTSHFVIVDCAGSSRPYTHFDTPNSKTRRLETECINAELFRLHSELKDLKYHHHSKDSSILQDTGLIRILRPYLNHNTNISVLFTLSAAKIHSHSTESTLKYAITAGLVKYRSLQADPALRLLKKKEQTPNLSPNSILTTTQTPSIPTPSPTIATDNDKDMPLTFSFR